MLRSLSFLLLLIAVTGTPALAQSRANTPDCQASIQGHSAAFWIEDLVGNTPLTWNRAESKVGDVEYQWAITPGKNMGDKGFAPAEFTLAFEIHRREQGPPVDGTLAKLMGEGVSVLYKRDYSRQKHPDHVPAQIVDGIRMKAGVHENGILMGTNDKKTFELIFGKRPSHVQLSAFHPAIGAYYFCVVAIDYGASK